MRLGFADTDKFLHNPRERERNGQIMNKSNKKADKLYSHLVDLIVIMIALVANIILYTVGNIIGLDYYYYDEYDYSLSGTTDAVFGDAIAEGKKVKISFCMAEGDVKNHSTGSEVYQTAKNFAERYPEFIELDYINIITRQDKDGNLINLSKYKTDMLGNETRIYKTSIIFECGENFKVVTDSYTSAGFADFYTLDASGNATSYNGEAFMASMIYWVTVNEHPTAYFTVGHSEQLDRAFASILISAGYVIDTIDLKKEEVPTDAGLLIISNPLSDFEKAIEGSGARTEAERLDTYVRNGGKVYVALDPYVKKLPVLEGFLAECGIAFSETDSDGTLIRNIIKDPNNAITTDGFTLVASFAENDIASAIGKTVSDYSEGSVIVREAAALELSKDAKPLLLSTPASSLEADGKTVDGEGSYPVAAYAKVKGDREQVASVCVVSSVYISVSDALITNGYSNSDFLYALFDNFYGQKGMPYGCDVLKADTSMLENLTMGKARMYTAFILAVPVVIAIAGTVVVTKRKNR